MSGKLRCRYGMPCGPQATSKRIPAPGAMPRTVHEYETSHTKSSGFHDSDLRRCGLTFVTGSTILYKW